MHAERCMRHEDVSKTNHAGRVKLYLILWLCDSFAELIEEMERNRRLLVETSKSTAAGQHLSHVNRAVGQQTGISAYHWKNWHQCIPLFTLGVNSVARQMHKQDGAALLGQHSQETSHGRGVSHIQRGLLIQPMKAALNQTKFLTQAQALLGKAISMHTTQQNAEIKSIINKDCQVAPKRMPLGANLMVNTYNMGGRFVESVKNARWSMSPQEARDGLESIVEFQVTSPDQRTQPARV